MNAAFAGEDDSSLEVHDVSFRPNRLEDRPLVSHDAVTAVPHDTAAAAAIKRRSITVEPIVLVLTIAHAITGPSSSQFLKLGSCLSKYGYANASLCRDIIANSSAYSNQSAEVSAEAAKFGVYGSLLDDAPAFFLVWLYGSWGDRYSRKLTLYVALVSALAQFLLAFVVMFLYQVIPFQLILLTSALSGLTGGGGAAIYASSSYIGQLSYVKQQLADHQMQAEDARSRTEQPHQPESTSRVHRLTRYSWQHSMFYMGLAVGYFLSGWVMQAGSMIGYIWYFVLPQAIGAALTVLVLVYLFVCVPELPPKYPGGLRRGALLQLLAPSNFIQPVKTVFRVREGTLRKQVLLSLSSLMLYGIAITALASCQFYFLTNLPIALEVKQYGYFNFGVYALGSVMLFVVLPFLKYAYPGADDAIFAVVGLLFQAYAQLMLAFATTTQQAYILLIPLVFRVWINTSLESVLSSRVPAEEQGAVFAALSSGNRILDIPSNFLFAYWIYPSTNKVFSGWVLIAGSIFMMPAVAAVIVLLYLRRKTKMNL